MLDDATFFPKNLPLVGLRPAAAVIPELGVADLFECRFYSSSGAAEKLPVELWCDLTKPGGAKGKPRLDMEAG